MTPPWSRPEYYQQPPNCSPVWGWCPQKVLGGRRLSCRPTPKRFHSHGHRLYLLLQRNEDHQKYPAYLRRPVCPRESLQKFPAGCLREHRQVHSEPRDEGSGQPGVHRQSLRILEPKAGAALLRRRNFPSVPCSTARVALPSATAAQAPPVAHVLY